MERKHLTHIQRLCEAHKSHCLARGWATEEEINSVWPTPKPAWTLTKYTPESYLKRWPTGPHAKAAKAILVDDTLDWVRCFGYLFRFTGRKEWLKDGSPHASEELMKALHDEPLEIDLVNPVNGTESVFVYPKSHWTLRWMEMNGWLYNWLFERGMVLREAADEGRIEKYKIPKPMELLEAVESELSVRDAYMCWVATCPEPFVPWTPGEDPWTPVGEPPQIFFDLSPIDVFRIRQAAQVVNLGRLQFLPKLAEKKQGKMNFDKYFASRARRAKQPAKYLSMHVTLASQLVEDSLAASSYEDELEDFG
jgi:hypothetical protein